MPGLIPAAPGNGVNALGVLEPDLSGFPPEAVFGPAFTPGWRSAIVSQSSACVEGPFTGVLAVRASAKRTRTPAVPMSRNYYSEINLHLTWHTKDSLPLLSDEVEPLAHRYVKQKIVNTQGAFVHEIGGTETHVHVAVTVSPTLLISEFVGQLKGASSHEVNKQLGLRDKTLQWQTGYGVVSFGTGQLDWVKAYIVRQREHHARGTVQGRLERITEIDA